MQKEWPVRKNIRLKEYDYSRDGYYFITICTHERKNTLALIRRDDPSGRPIIELTELGKICLNTLNEIENKHNISIPKYIIMPDHIHIIITILNENAQNTERTTARVVPTIGAIIGGYKSMISNAWLKKCKECDIYMGEIWQSRFHDHIIRDESEYRRIWQYIDENPARWSEDGYYV